MSGTDRQRSTPERTTIRRQGVRAAHPRTFAALLLCSLLTSATAPGSPSAGSMFNAEPASGSTTGIGVRGVPDPAPLPDPSPVDGASPRTAGQSVVVANTANPPAPAAQVVVSMLASDGIPVVASAAYHHAADLANQRSVNCHIPWTLVAAIGRVESDHGRFAGSVLLTNGLSTPRIIGIALNGVGTALVLDTDHGALDGDPVYDHAIGPMQFIPSTWAQYATDGNGDGVADPFNIYDAAAASGKYLCSAGTDLRTESGKKRAVFAYNHSDSYVATVLSLEAAYAGALAIVEPASVTRLPGVSLPPVNPGVPTAIYPKFIPLASHGLTPPLAGKPGLSKPPPELSTPAPIPTPPVSQQCQPTPATTTPAPAPIDATPTPTTPAPTDTTGATPTPSPTTPAPTDTTGATPTPSPTPCVPG